jgi:hypothetical protein
MSRPLCGPSVSWAPFPGPGDTPLQSPRTTQSLALNAAPPSPLTSRFPRQPHAVHSSWNVHMPFAPSVTELQPEA